MSKLTKVGCHLSNGYQKEIPNINFPPSNGTSMKQTQITFYGKAVRRYCATIHLSTNNQIHPSSRFNCTTQERTNTEEEIELTVSELSFFTDIYLLLHCDDAIIFEPLQKGNSLLENKMRSIYSIVYWQDHKNINRNMHYYLKVFTNLN